MFEDFVFVSLGEKLSHLEYMRDRMESGVTLSQIYDEIEELERQITLERLADFDN